jgi:hypothetical protein
MDEHLLLMMERFVEEKQLNNPFSDEVMQMNKSNIIIPIKND